MTNQTGSLSYHDLFITTANIPRTSIFNLPCRLMVICTRACGWELWAGDTLIAGEFSEGKWLILDVAGNIIAGDRGRVIADPKTETP